MTIIRVGNKQHGWIIVFSKQKEVNSNRWHPLSDVAVHRRASLRDERGELLVPLARLADSQHRAFLVAGPASEMSSHRSCACYLWPIKLCFINHQSLLFSRGRLLEGAPQKSSEWRNLTRRILLWAKYQPAIRVMLRMKLKRLILADSR